MDDQQLSTTGAGIGSIFVEITLSNSLETNCKVNVVSLKVTAWYHPRQKIPSRKKKNQDIRGSPLNTLTGFSAVKITAQFLNT